MRAHSPKKAGPRMKTFRFPRVDIYIIAILFFAATLRLWQLGTIPSGVLSDEVEIGYIAYSLGKIGVSTYGDTNIFAIQETSGGSRPPLYIYSAVPSVMLFGLTPFAIRLPSALFGIFSVLIFYLLLQRVFASALVSKAGALLFAFNPWAIQISRQALLESITLFFVLTGVYAFVLGKDRIWPYLIAAACFIASLFSYDAPKIFLPPFLLALMLLYRKKLWRAPKVVGIFLLVMVLGYAFMLHTTFFNLQVNDFNAVSIFRWADISGTVNTESELTTAPLWLSGIFHNKVTVIIKNVITSYASIFSLNWFFVNGAGNLQHSVARHGEFFLFELPLFFFGLAAMLSGNAAGGTLFLLWLMIGALPGGLTTTNSPLRSVLMLPAPLAISALGFSSMMRRLERCSNNIRRIFFVLRAGILCLYVTSFLFTYFFDYPVYASEWWSKQQDDAIRFVIEKKQAYPHVFINGRWRIMYAFFAQIDPALVLASSKRQETYNTVPVISLGNVIFGDFSQATKDFASPSAFFPKGSLLITDGDKFPHETPLKDFLDPGGVRILYKAIEVR